MHKQKINSTQVDDAHDIDTVMPMHNLIEYSNVYWKTSRNLWQYYKDQSALENNNNNIDFLDNNNNGILFKLKQQIRGQTGNCSTKDFEIMFPLKYVSSFWRAREMPLINCEISLKLKWSRDCFLVASTEENQAPEIK